MSNLAGAASASSPDGGWPEPLAVLAVSPPEVTMAEALAVARSLYGVSGEGLPLRGERDCNVLLRADGGASYVLKFAHAAEHADVSDFQTRALLHVAAVDPALPVPRVVPTGKGDPAFAYTAADGTALCGRLVTYLVGAPVADQRPSPVRAAAMGAMAARLDRALRGFSHPAAGHALMWDLQQAPHLSALLPFIGVEDDRRIVAAALDVFRRDVEPRLPGLRAQVIHNDLNPHNILVAPGTPDVPCAIIDFGDMVHAPLIQEVAIAAAYLVGDGADPLDAMSRFVAGYHAVTPLEAEEIALLPDLIATRNALTIAITAWRAARYPDNAAYIMRNRGAAAIGAERLAALGRDVVAARLCAACGLD